MSPPGAAALPATDLPQPGTRGALAMTAIGLGMQVVMGFAAAFLFGLLYALGVFAPVSGDLVQAMQQLDKNANYVLLVVLVSPMGLLVTVAIAVAINKPRAGITLNLARITKPLLIAAGCLGATALGELMGWVSSLMFKPGPWIEMLTRSASTLTFPKFLLFAFAGSVGAGIGEEMLFRGYLQQRLVKRLGPVAGILLASALFGAFHIYPGHIFPTFFIGLVLGCLAYASRSIWPGVIAHIFNNAFTLAWMRIFAPGPEDTAHPAQLAVAAALALPCLFFIGRAVLARVREDSAETASMRDYVRGMKRAELPVVAELPVATVLAASA